MRDEKALMWEAAVLYYEQNCTQQEIAERIGLSRQTVSKLLSDAIRENIVEIRIHQPKQTLQELQQQLCQRFGLSQAVVCSISRKDPALQQLMTVRAASEHLLPLFSKGDQNIAVSWGRTIEALIREMPYVKTERTHIFPLFGATDRDESYFLSNELARGLGEKLGAHVQYAWFPYAPESDEDRELFRRTSYYKKMQQRWNNIDLAVVGLGNRTANELLGDAFRHSANVQEFAGDIATHFFTLEGRFHDQMEHTLCATVENLQAAKHIVAIACGDDKTQTIQGALRTGLLHTLITDEYTARAVLDL